MALFRLTSNVLVQDDAADTQARDVVQWSDIRDVPPADVTRIAHVVNWYTGDKAAASLQAVTALTMSDAARFARDTETGRSGLLGMLGRFFAPGRALPGPLNPRLVACVAAGEEAAVAPAGFRTSRPLNRTVLDVGTFNVPRRLPLLFDILERGSEIADPRGFLVYTNADICLMPHFYRSIQALLSRGFDCLIINRRTVGPLSAYGGWPEAAMLEAGRRHPGLDCFIFPAAWVAGFARSDACVGAGWVMRSLLYNLVARSKKMLILRDAHLTYHFGDDQAWNDIRLEDYVSFNLEQARSVLARLYVQARRRELLSAFCAAHQEPLRPET